MGESKAQCAPADGTCAHSSIAARRIWRVMNLLGCALLHPELGASWRIRALTSSYPFNPLRPTMNKIVSALTLAAFAAVAFNAQAASHAAAAPAAKASAAAKADKPAAAAKASAPAASAAAKK